MQRKFLNLAYFAALFGILVLCSCSTLGPRVSTAEYPFLVHPDRKELVTWRKLDGPDFDVFYGQPKANNHVSFGFYRGGHPKSSEAGDRILNGSLGAFAVDCHEETLPTGEVRRSAVFYYNTRIIKHKNDHQESRFTEKIHIWISAADGREMKKWIDYLGGLELFRTKPNDVIEVR